MYACRAIISSALQRCGGQAPMTGVLEWKDAGSLGRTLTKAISSETCALQWRQGLWNAEGFLHQGNPSQRRQMPAPGSPCESGWQGLGRASSHGSHIHIQKLALESTVTSTVTRPGKQGMVCQTRYGAAVCSVVHMEGNARRAEDGSLSVLGATRSSLFTETELV